MNAFFMITRNLKKVYKSRIHRQFGAASIDQAGKNKKSWPAERRLK